MVRRKGMGVGGGKGYKNIVVKDKLVHSQSAKGIKQTKPNTFWGAEYPSDISKVPEYQRQGLIKELARKVVGGAKWAIKWERDHLPNQEAWVKKQFHKAKDLAHRSKDKKIDFIEKKAQDLHDVRDELDTDDDGTQDITMAELQDVNTDITTNLEGIDEDNNAVPDYKEEHVLDMDMRIPPPKPPTGVKAKLVEFREKRRTEREELESMSDTTLREKSVRADKGFFGGLDKYGKELLRRDSNRITLQKERAKKKLEAKKGKGDSFMKDIFSLK